MKRAQKQLVGGVVVAALAAGVGGYAWVRSRTGPQPPPAGPSSPLAEVDLLEAPSGAAPVAIGPQPPGAPSAAQGDSSTPPGALAPLAATGPNDAASLDTQLQRGRELLQAGKRLEARALLSELFFSGRLNAQQEKQAVQDLTMLAELTIFSPRIAGDDPYAMQYTIRPGDNLVVLERRLGLHVPTQILAKINNLPSASALRAGSTIKLLQGPVHATISKSRFTMDLYLQRDPAPKVFLLRLPVGLGANDSTPLGRFQVQQGKKLRNTTWTPPPGSGRTGVYRPGDAGYPLGKEGYWIGLVGIDENTARHNGYGIHGTNEPDSIGRNASLGCIRLDDHNIELVFSLLYEKWSTVEIVP